MPRGPIAALAAAALLAGCTAITPQRQPQVRPDGVVVLPACPDWSAWPNYSTFHNQPYSDWSCATAVNLGMMVANPADLVRGRVPGQADGTVMARSVEAYRKGRTKPLLDDVSTAETFSGDAGGESN